MFRSLGRNLALIAAIALVLPVGWCRAILADDCGVPRAQAAASCCPASDAENSAPAPHAPRVPQACCCARDPVPPTKPVQWQPEVQASPIALPVEPLAATGILGFISPEADLCAGPPLRILQCVWRC